MSPSKRRFPADAEELQKLLLECGANDGPTQADRERAIGNIAAAAATATTAGIVAASMTPNVVVSSAKVSALMAAKWALAGALVATTAIGVGTVVQRDTPHQERSPPVFSAPHGAPRRANAVSSSPSKAVADEERSAEPVTEEVRGELENRPHVPSPFVEDPSPQTPRSPETSERRSAPVPWAAPPVGGGPSPAGEPHDKTVTPSLKRELALLEAARGNLRLQASAAALAALNTYDRTFPAGTLKAEAAALRIEALVAAGRREEAAILARTFLAMYPDSPLNERIRALFPGARN
jgi:hypothetical protein